MAANLHAPGIALGISEVALNQAIAAIFPFVKDAFYQSYPFDAAQGFYVDIGGTDPPYLVLDPSSGTAAGTDVTATLSWPLIWKLVADQGFKAGESVMSCTLHFMFAGGNEGAFSTLKMTDPVIEVPGDPDSERLLNEFARNDFLGYLDSAIVRRIQLPMPVLSGIVIDPEYGVETMPSGEQALIGHQTLGRSAAFSAPQTDWIREALLLALGADVLAQIVAAALPQPHGDGGTSSPNTSWSYNATLAPTVILPGDGNDLLDIRIDIGGDMDFTVHMPGFIPNLSAGGSISGSATAKARIVTRTGPAATEILFVIEDIVDMGLYPHIDGLPGIRDLFAKIIEPFVNQIGRHLLGGLAALQIKLATFPRRPAGAVNSDNALPQEFGPVELRAYSTPGPAGLPILLVCGVPGIFPEPPPTAP